MRKRYSSRPLRAFPFRIRHAAPVWWSAVVSQLDSPTRGDGPVRTCIGCRVRAAKRELLRVVAGTDAKTQDRAHGSWFVVPDPRGTAPGRGAHLHPTLDCLALAERKRAFVRALRHETGERGPLSLERLREHLTRHDAAPR
ncbi:YlxR family protein [Marmoricola sp. URHB0036]|uniref:YlxR family protein n=1 Tax=Marmoricola sp. URHB0036 TaxID=1298863 RepID=UPI0009DC24FE|nr:YlxR family protein [Marmoricola sp. URHB0036]